MKRNHYIILLIVLAASSLASCKKDFLDVKKIPADMPIELMYKRYDYIQGIVWNAYSYMPDGFAWLDMEAATDDAYHTNVNNRSHSYNYGVWNQFDNPEGTWTDNFKGINQANLFLKHKGEVDLSSISNGIVNNDSVAYKRAVNNLRFMEGECHFLKALFYFELVKRYGAVPIIDQVLDYNQPSTWRGLPRNSVDECFRYIASLCDKAAVIIPDSVRTSSSTSWYESGRITYGAIKALKARALLYAASPLYKDAGSTFTWADAAAAAREVIAMNVFNLDASYANVFGATNVASAEAIFFRRHGNQNGLERNNFPIVFEGSNGNSVTPSQNYVDEFEVKTGATSIPFDWNNPVHAANPYSNRDPRLAASVVYNGATFKSTTIQTYFGGNSGQPKLNTTKTGYYLGKHVNPTVDLLNNTTTTHQWLYIRYAEVLLNYAEAMYNAYGAAGDPLGYGMTALQAINRVRTRATMPALTDLSTDALVHERRVELGFEGHRWWDLRRWKKGALLANPIRSISITLNGANFVYTPTKLEDRVFDQSKMNWYPIPQAEITKTGWEQNAGWGN
ncbi:RagB/SusD family nutrient uptake outer membrane protein [Paraflavitalea soli]|uniref:RagB/SusD family nutrient uptake outer membrane protein n=1 Tax=Paraflavitalea soli TaxID=2315862 RepID=A0A3B7N1U2_9BACT|nr:RagB/SusD family nutrient uptake outer membrane protein [Paraflavitalea soli]AXY78025.1 RagB/SusD family nutrient uptake outer membrane protein [Paraflavitalea soli]